MYSEIKYLLTTLNPMNYTNRLDRHTLQKFSLDKSSLFIRFVYSFSHGHVGIRYDIDDQDELMGIQHELDRIFTKGQIHCRRLLNHHVVLYPHPSYFGMDTNHYPFSFIRSNQRYADFEFPSCFYYERHVQLLESIKNFVKTDRRTLKNICWYQLSTLDLYYIRKKTLMIM